ncbi:eCIS core domain-containing protein [Halogeometricum borinquense]|uniref:eCIS core domain-containing protein n=1 Tax=Halogeometricum borinquense (strain ATCC 700274 / DSM 11551 / JCM 10706 / KCTC 4070 / PR3) TaxID=469382 RepID=E4NSR1_HALBP|nr:hypothetical protein Hbor_01880 [Halogeometricum borinquense DSM 11551]
MDGLDTKIQRLAKKHGADQVRQWADEGMTVDTMGKPRDMRAFRQRQKERPAEVPKDIERRNAKSVQRSRGAHHEASKAGDANVPDSVRDVISSPGQQLDTSIQRAMEDRMGDNLGDVRVHTGPSAAKACEDINARAFTVGNHIAFNHGEYDPSSAEGQHILAHELAHVRQQTGGAVSMLPQEGELEIDPDPRLEREAEETAQRVMQGGKIGVHRMEHSDVHVQRMPGAETVLGGATALVASQMMIPKMLEEGEQLQEIRENWDDIDGHEVAYEGFKAQMAAYANIIPGVKGVRAAKNNAQQQFKESNFQDRLAEANFPDSWKGQLAEMDPPETWLDEARRVAQEVSDGTGSGDRPERVPSADEVSK